MATHRHLCVLVGDYSRETQRMTNTTRRQYGDALGALSAALKARCVGQAVIIRPSFNETLDGKYQFREWRSFDGALFTEHRWEIPSDSTDRWFRERRDIDVLLPNPNN